MSKTTAASATTSSPPPPPTIVSKDLPPGYVDALQNFLLRSGVADTIAEDYTSKDFYSDLIRDLLTAQQVQRGRVTCVFSVLPLFMNMYNGLHGGVVAAIAERVSIACARTVLAEDKDLFLGELSMSYLSAAQRNEMLVVDGSVVRSGRNLTVVAIEFRIEKTEKLLYTARATFYHLPAAKL